RLLLIFIVALGEIGGAVVARAAGLRRGGGIGIGGAAGRAGFGPDHLDVAASVARHFDRGGGAAPGVIVLRFVVVDDLGRDLAVGDDDAVDPHQDDGGEQLLA